MWFRRTPKTRPRKVWGLDQRVLEFSPQDPFTIGQSVEGTLVVGATGSGKSTGSGRCLAMSYLAAGYGGLVLTAKSDERAQWQAYCRATGRLADLQVFSASGDFRFNILDYEHNRKGAGAGLTENLVNLLAEVMEIGERQSGKGGREDEAFWRRANRQLTRNAIDLLVMATGRVSIPDLYRLVVSAPTSLEQVRSDDWRSRSFCFKCLREADARPKSDRQRHDFEIVADFFLVEFAGLSDKTRSVILSTFTSMVDVFNRGILRELFCGSTNITPEAIREGAIILVDLPVKEFGEVGVFSQVLWKYAFQKSIERRDVATSPRPVFLWADEAQFFVTSSDSQFQTTCRASLVATVMLTQNISNFYAALGGNDKGKAEVDSLLANLNSKIFHAQSCPVTNDWAASIIGRSRQFFTNASSSYDQANWMSELMGYRRSGNTSAGVTESIEFEVQPRVFTTLRKGGPASGWQVDGIVFQGGRRFARSGKTWLKVSFSQK
jgi:hypothetical protein